MPGVQQMSNKPVLKSCRRNEKRQGAVSKDIEELVKDPEIVNTFPGYFEVGRINRFSWLPQVKKPNKTSSSSLAWGLLFCFTLNPSSLFRDLRHFFVGFSSPFYVKHKQKFLFTLVPSEWARSGKTNNAGFLQGWLHFTAL